MTRSVTNKQTNKKHHIFAPTALCDLPQTLHGDSLIELVVPIIESAIHFLIQRIVFPIACTEKFGLIYVRAVSQQ